VDAAQLRFLQDAIESFTIIEWYLLAREFGMKFGDIACSDHFKE